jgi:hypothetical protein
MAGLLYRVWTMTLENEAAHQQGLPLPHLVDLQAYPFHLNARVALFVSRRDKLRADLAAYLSSESQSMATASEGPSSLTETPSPTWTQI